MSSSDLGQKRRRVDEGAAKKNRNEDDLDHSDTTNQEEGKDYELEDLLRSVMPDDVYNDGGQIEQARGEILQKRDRLLSMLRAIGGDSPEIASLVTDVTSVLNTIPDPNRPKLTEEKKREIKRLVDSGASLRRIDALHKAASKYKQKDLFDLLIDEYGIGIEDHDHQDPSSPPLHVAALLGNCEAVEILLSKGANKKSKNSKGRTIQQEIKTANRQAQKSMGPFMAQRLQGEMNVDKVLKLLN
jgi:hypothetical protein